MFAFEYKINGVGGDSISPFVNIDLLNPGFGERFYNVRESVIAIEEYPVVVDGIPIPGHSRDVMPIVDVILATVQGAAGCQQGEAE